MNVGRGDITKTDVRSWDICDICGWSNYNPGYESLRTMNYTDHERGSVICSKCLGEMSKEKEPACCG